MHVSPMFLGFAINENPNFRAVAKILRARASEHSFNVLRAIRTKVEFFEHFEQDHSIPQAEGWEVSCDKQASSHPPGSGSVP